MAIKILNLIFKHISPFSMDLYERMDGRLFIIGIRYNRFLKEGQIKKSNSLGFFFGYKYKILTWLS